MHEHHVIPQAYGGVNGPTVILCPDHHNEVHKIALAVIVAARSGKRVEPRMPPSVVKKKIFSQLVQAIVVAALKSPVREYTLPLKLNQEQRQLLGLLKTELGVSSLEKAMLTSFELVARSRGLL